MQRLTARFCCCSRLSEHSFRSRWPRPLHLRMPAASARRAHPCHDSAASESDQLAIRSTGCCNHDCCRAVTTSQCGKSAARHCREFTLRMWMRDITESHLTHSRPLNLCRLPIHPRPSATLHRLIKSPQEIHVTAWGQPPSAVRPSDSSASVYWRCDRPSLMIAGLAPEGFPLAIGDSLRLIRITLFAAVLLLAPAAFAAVFGSVRGVIHDPSTAPCKTPW